MSPGVDVDAASDLAVSDVDLRPAGSREYELTATATATVDGPAGRLRVERRYEALPRHNDVVDPGAVDSNDALVNRPDAVHVHTKLYVVGADGEDYLSDAHAARPAGDPSALGDPERFLDACRVHHLGDLARSYDRGAAVLRRRPGRGPGGG